MRNQSQLVTARSDGSAGYERSPTAPAAPPPLATNAGQASAPLPGVRSQNSVGLSDPRAKIGSTRVISSNSMGEGMPMLTARTAGAAQMPAGLVPGPARADLAGSIPGHGPAAGRADRPSAPGGVSHRYPLTRLPCCRIRHDTPIARIRSGPVLRIILVACPSAQPGRPGRLVAASRRQSAAGDGRRAARPTSEAPGAGWQA